MIDDIWTIMWKEFKETLPLREVRTGIIPRLVLPILIVGVFLPWQFGKEWMESPITLLSWSWLSPFLVTGLVADSFAGERERHTIETLLASRLSDTAILFGKIGAAVGYGFGLTLAGMLVGLITINFAYGRGQILLYTADITLITIIVSLLITMLVASIGILISLRAPTVRHATQTLSIGFIILWFAIIYGIQVTPVEWRAGITNFLTTLGGTNILFLVIVLLGILDTLFIALAKARFKRAKLILD